MSNSIQVDGYGEGYDEQGKENCREGEKAVGFSDGEGVAFDGIGIVLFQTHFNIIDFRKKGRFKFFYYSLYKGI